MNASSANPRAQLTASSWMVVALAGLLTAGLCLHLWPEWMNNPDLSHGLFAPVLFLLLLSESRRSASQRFLEDGTGLRVLRGGAIAGGLGAVGFAGLYAAAVEWSHPLVGMLLAIALSGLLLASLLWLCTAGVRALPFNWTSLVAVSIWPLCAPLPPGTYSRISLQLQLWVTDIVLHSLHLLGVAAFSAGNVINLAHTSVGVEEACSGVRSLLSCFVAAVFFSATLVRRPWARALLIALAPPLAFGMNIIRSLTLTLLANDGVDISGTWHDLTGFAVLGVTAMILAGLALWLEEPVAATAKHSESAPLITRDPTRAPPLPWGLISGYALATALVVFFVINTHGPARPAGTPPNLQTILPAAPSGWDLVRTDDLFQFSSVLKTENLLERTYVRRQVPGAESELLQITVYIAYWSPGQVPVSQVAIHSPDACWPGTGWVAQPMVPARIPFRASGSDLAVPEYRAFTNTGSLQHVWFWHLYDGRSIAQNDPRSAGALLKLAWNYGFRTAGEQMFVRFSSNRPWSEIRDDPLLAGIVAQLKPFGL